MIIIVVPTHDRIHRIRVVYRCKYSIPQSITLFAILKQYNNSNGV